jgi:enediyne biosynthesis protein E4
VTSGRRLSRRQRRAALTAVVLAMAMGVVAVLLVGSYRRRHAGQYRPGEQNADITAGLTQGLPADAPKPRFTDVTAEAGLGDVRTFAGPRSSQLPEDMGPGAAWGDFDNDGDDDVMIMSAGGALSLPPSERAPSRLYENVGGRFRPVADFPDTRIPGTGAAWSDVDGDGWLDLVLTGYNTLLLYRNNHGHLMRDEHFPNPPGFWTGAVWGDFDNDGDLDLYVCGYVQYIPSEADRSRVSEHYGSSVPYTLNPASYQPQRNLLFRNDGRGRFTEVGVQLGVSNPEGRSLSAVWHDFDDDGWLDLYVANDISDNVLYSNQHGRFIDVSHPAWVADYRGAMGLAVGDWNRDGDDDLFITHWVAQENALYDSLLRDTSTPAQATPPARPGRSPDWTPVRFADAADSAGLGQIALPMVGWGAEFADFDGDGWLDLAVANGSTFETDETPRRLKPQLPFLFWNRHGEFFHDLAPLVPAMRVPHVARGLAVSDFDNDGDLDILIVRNGEGVQLLRNDMQRGHWLELSLRSAGHRGGPANGRGVGANVTVHAGGIAFRRSVSSASYLSQSTTVVHVGLGSISHVDGVDVRWRGDTVTHVADLAADHCWEIAEGATSARPCVRPPVPQAALPAAAPAAATMRLDPARQIAFWNAQRAAMTALKRDHDTARAAVLLQQALEIDPSHEDSRYYLGNALAAQGDIEGGLAQFDSIVHLNPSSHRARARWGELRAIGARSRADLVAAESALDAAHRLNPEETGVLLALGEVALMRGSVATAEQRLEAACATNPRAAGGLFLLGYIHWKRGDSSGAHALLVRARSALGPEWKPQGATAEGDVAKRAHEESTPLAGFFDSWTGSSIPAAAYAALDRELRQVRRLPQR